MSRTKGRFNKGTSGNPGGKKRMGPLDLEGAPPAAAEDLKDSRRVLRGLMLDEEQPGHVRQKAAQALASMAVAMAAAEKGPEQWRPARIELWQKKAKKRSGSKPSLTKSNSSRPSEDTDTSQSSQEAEQARRAS